MSLLGKLRDPRVLAMLGLGGGLAASEAMADPGDSENLLAAREALARIERERDDFRAADSKRKQQILVENGAGYTKDDGILGLDSGAKIEKYFSDLEQRASDAQKAIDVATKDQAYQRTRPSVGQEIMREAMPWVGTAVGGLAGLAGRGGAVKKAAKGLLAKIAESDALVDTSPVSLSRADRPALHQRIADVNDFWVRGESEGAVPFIQKKSGGWRHNPDALGAAELYPEPNTFLRANDLGWMGAAAGETGLSGAGWAAAEEELKTAEEIARNDPTEANLARVQRAHDMVMWLSTATRLGLSYLGGRGFGAFKTPYVHQRPNVPGAEAERAMLSDAVKKIRK